MAKPKIGKPVTLVIPPEIIEEVSRIAKKRDISKADVYRMLMKAGLECHKEMEKFGVIQAVDFIYYVKESVKRRSQKVGDKQMKLI